MLGKQIVNTAIVQRQLNRLLNVFLILKARFTTVNMATIKRKNELTFANV